MEKIKLLWVNFIYFALLQKLQSNVFDADFNALFSNSSTTLWYKNTTFDAIIRKMKLIQ